MPHPVYDIPVCTCVYYDVPVCTMTYLCMTVHFYTSVHEHSTSLMSCMSLSSRALQPTFLITIHQHTSQSYSSHKLLNHPLILQTIIIDH